MARSKRMDAVEEAGREGKNRNLARYYWVDIDKLERFGLVVWAPKEGANFISVIPPVDDDIFYAREVYVHYHVGGDKGPTHLCMRETKDVLTKKKWNKPCAVCDKRARLSENDATRESAEELKPSRRFLMYIADTSDLPEDATTKEMEKSGKKVQWYDSSPTFRDRITGVSENKRSGGWIDVSDPDNGKTVCFDRIGKGKKTKYENFALEARQPIPDKWLEVPDYDDVFLIPNYDEVAAEVDLKSYSEATEDEPEGRPRSRRERTVDEGAPSEEEPTRTRRTRRPVEDDPEEKTEEKPEEKPEEPKNSKEDENETTSGDDEVAAIRQRIKDKKRDKE